MAPQWRKEDIEKLIIQMQHHPCLHNVNNRDYLDRVKKAQAMNDVLEEMKKSMSGITLEDVKTKWRILRIQLGKELRMINISEKIGAETYVPKLWCFDQLSFLKAHTAIRSGKDNIEHNGSQDNIENESTQESIVDEESSNSIYLEDEIKNEEPPKKRFKNTNNMEQLRNELREFMNVVERKKEKKYAWLGKLVAAQMDEIHPDEQADAAWQVQCLLRSLTSKSGRSSPTWPISPKKEIPEF